MSNSNETIVVAAFETEEDAQQAMEEMKDANRTQMVNLKDIAYVQINAEGNVQLEEQGEGSASKAVTVGSVVGLALGALMTKAVSLAGSGIVLGLTGASVLADNLAARLRGAGFDDAQLTEMAGSIQRGGVAVVTVAGANSVDVVNQIMGMAGAKIMTPAGAEDADAQSIPVVDEDDESETESTPEAGPTDEE